LVDKILKAPSPLVCPSSEQRLRSLLDDELIEIAAYENLAACWNRRGRYISAEEAFQLYERNWRLVDTRNMQAAERALIERLAGRYDNGVLNVWIRGRRS
jgi:hypothetical protein